MLEVNKMQKLNTISDYSKWVGYAKDLELIEIPCELCGEKEFDKILDHTDGGDFTLVPVPVSRCKNCGYIFQNPRPSSEFYDDFYNKLYSTIRLRSSSHRKGDPNNSGGNQELNNDGTSSDFGFNNAIQRANSLHSYLISRNMIRPQFKGSIFDMGCGSGGFIKYFRDIGWSGLGNDPDTQAIASAKARGVNNLIHANSEDLNLPNNTYDLIVIIGSLEHCRDPNKVLEICYKSLKVGGIIVNEGRYYPVSYSYRWFNANHQRFLEHSSSVGMMLKHGFDLIESTIYPVCGLSTGRNGGGWVFARKQQSEYKKRDNDSFIKEMKKQKAYKTLDQLCRQLKSHDDYIQKYSKDEFKCTYSNVVKSKLKELGYS